ncbi:arginase family-domain-containing protein [Paraphoma chrysanthemicola]|uniref:Arginase family-domain-containing protein n=1 Tax=Paraphoma chrysanthemicola TaxID=798071 RepID=A0A8K0W035_9PLEO|nr:arginase family-domain-containing protein [Paraphoma chrysanthemicola]
MLCASSFLFFAALAGAREIVFPPVSGYTTDQAILRGYNDPDISQPKFAGLMTYANLPYVHCLAADGEEVERFDIAIMGAPFDTGVTARPGARFGPAGIRQGSRRITPTAGWDIYTGENVLLDWAKIVDCGDAPLTFLDNTAALKQLDKAHKIVSSKRTTASDYTTPRIVTLGGDHTTTLSALRSTFERWGPVSVIHFDSHIDTWDPKVLGGGISHYAGVNHGTFLHIAHEEGLIRNTSIHAGIRAPVIRPKGDVRNDLRCGFEMVKARDIDRLGTQGVIDRLKKRVAGTKVYISVDIDVLDPAFAPATGTSEVGGWSTRELLTILDGLEGLEVVGADVVEVAPVYDSAGETTVLAAAEVALSLIGLMVKKPVIVPE